MLPEDQTTQPIPSVGNEESRSQPWKQTLEEVQKQENNIPQERQGPQGDYFKADEALYGASAAG